MNVGVHVSEEVAAKWPAYRAAVVIAEGVRSGPSDDASERLLTAAEQAVRESGLERAADDPRIAAWRAVFSEFGSKPSRYPARPSRAARACGRASHCRGSTRWSTPTTPSACVT